MASSIVSISSSNPSSFGNVLRHQSENNILKLKLKKPKSWNWELSTSKSSAHIDFPRILLYDNNDKLLADIEEANLIIGSKENEPISPMQISSPESNNKNRLRKSNSFCVSNSKTPTTIDFDGSKNSINEQINGRLEHYVRSRSVSHKSEKSHEKIDVSDKPIESHNLQNEVSMEDTQMPEAPIYIYSAKGLVKRDFNAKEFDGIRNRSNSQAINKYEGNPTTETEQTITKRVTSKTADSRAQSQIPQNHLTVQTNKNPLMKCKSMAEIVDNELVKKGPKRKIRRTKSSVSTKSQLQNMAQNSSSSSCEENDTKPTRRPAYHIQASAAGAIIVPDEPVFSERRRRRCRSKSVDKSDRINHRNKVKAESDRIRKLSKLIHKTDNSMPNLMLSDPMDTTPTFQIINEREEIVPLIPNAMHQTDEKKHANSLKCENNWPNMQNSAMSSSSSNNNVNSCNDVKQKKSTVNRKVSFVQFNCDTENNGNYENYHHDNIINAQQTEHFNQNGKCINNSSKKKVYRKIRKSASVGGLFNDYSIASAPISSTDIDDDDLHSKPVVRHKKRRVSQRLKLNNKPRHGESLTLNTYIYFEIYF